jgi:hypothetical protein
MTMEMHRADPRSRRLAPLLLLGVAVLGVAAVWALKAWLGSNAAPSGAPDTLLLLAAGIVIVLATVSFALAVVLWQEGGRIRREDRFPPSDMRTLRDVPVRHGAAARRVAGMMRGGAVCAALAGAGVLAWGYRLLRLVA